MELQALLDEVAAKGLTVMQWREMVTHPSNPNAPSVTVGGWWCELRHPNGFRDSDTGATAEAALRAALDRACSKKGAENRPIMVATDEISAETAAKLRNAKPHEVVEVSHKEMKALTKPKKPVDLDFLD